LRKERTLVDVRGGYQLTRRLELMLSVRNIFNAPSIQYSDEPGRGQRYDVHGSLWNFGIKGTFQPSPLKGRGKSGLRPDP
jgi:iron complex outermembrane receptor protein